MEKLTIIFGGTQNFYQTYLKPFDAIEKKFNCKIKKTGSNKLSTKIKNTKIEFKFCLHPTRDENYKYLKKLKEKNKEIAPPPADELVKNLKSERILFLGVCGGLKGKKDDIYIPTKFSEIYFKNFIKKEEIPKIKPKNKMKIDNFLSRKIKSKGSGIITSNLTLMPDAVESGDENNLIKLSKKLSKFGNAIDKESYQIAKHFKNKIPLGFAFMSSDIISTKKNMLRRHSFKPNIKKFDKLCINSIEIALEKLQKN